MQPTNAISYAYIPVTMNTITEADVRAFQAAVRKSDGPVLAHCKTGTRSLSLYLIGEVLDGRMSVEDVVPFGHQLGFDTSVAASWPQRFADRRPQVKGFSIGEPPVFSTWCPIRQPVCAQL